jgi:hypothetical protein
MTRLRLKGPPSGVLVVEALAILSEMTSVRRRSAVIPEAAMLIVVKSPIAPAS